MNIVGLNFFHADTSATILKNNQIVAAVEEERFTRIKHFSGFPIQSLDYCLKKSNLKLNDIDIISVNSNPYYNLSSKIKFALGNPFKLSQYFKRLSRIKLRTDINDHLYKYFGNTENIKLDFVPHHLSHACSSVYCSGYKDGLSISFDATGDFSTLEVYNVNNNKLSKLFTNKFPHSIGILYQAITQYCGFRDYGDEYKLMGLAAYGKPNFVSDIKKLYSYKKNKFKLNLDYFSHHIIGFDFNFGDNIPFFKDLFSDNLVKLLGSPRRKGQEINQRFKDIACSLQRCFEDLVLEIVIYYQKKTNQKNLFLSGGCAFNALNNKSLIEKTDFNNVFIQPNSGDAGGSLGAALYTNYKFNNNFSNSELESIYLGPKDDNKDVKKNLDFLIGKNDEFKIEEFSDFQLLINETAEMLLKGNIVAWHQDRMEFGPRALGNRSILANPGFADIKNMINNKIKNREEFRPFAPSVLEEMADEFFELNKNCNYEFMNIICDSKYEKSNLIPGVINIDSTSRPQIVKKNKNLKYYNLIKQFYLLSNIPMLLNTSLNIQEPICCTSNDTIRCFLKSNIDALAIENFLVKRIKNEN